MQLGLKQGDDEGLGAEVDLLHDHGDLAVLQHGGGAKVLAQVGDEQHSLVGLRQGGRGTKAALLHLGVPDEQSVKVQSIRTFICEIQNYSLLKLSTNY